jgi:hypothetical protein
MRILLLIQGESEVFCKELVVIFYICWERCINSAGNNSKLYVREFFCLSLLYIDVCPEVKGRGTSFFCDCC